MTRVYKLTTRDAWDDAVVKGVFEGAPIDLKDGYIHFSTARQAAETARLYFAGVRDLLLVGFDGDDFGDALKWEASRGGDLFPHLYGELPTASAVEIRDIPLDAEGVPILGDLTA
jgi:uncharacterized protein (DUF952 family)